MIERAQAVTVAMKASPLTLGPEMRSLIVAALREKAAKKQDDK
jgi:hypothetical protein